MTTTQHARVANYQYTSGTPFHMVHCNTCNIVLNSGHHYSDRYLDAAQRCADRHNAEEHGDTEAAWRLYEATFDSAARQVWR